MNKIHNAIFMLPLVGTLLLGSCGDPLSLAEGGIGGTGISTGTVTGIGSITVNGVKFNTDNAAIYVEGVRVDNQCIAGGNETCLRDVLGFSEGQVVRVVGTFNADGRTGTADAVYYNDSIEGPIENITQIDATTLLLEVMGQTVIVNSQTYLFDMTPAPITLNDINDGDLIEVSGLLDDRNRIQAGYLLNKGTYNQSNAVEIKGIIDIGSLGPNNFRINGLLVDYSAASPVPDLHEGIQVEVKGTYNGTKINAISIERDDDVDGIDYDKVEYEGIVMSGPVPSLDGLTFMLGTKYIQTNSNTEFKSGLAADITPGVQLEVEGYLEAGILIAHEVRFRDSTEIDAQVDNYTATVANDSVTITLTGLAGVNILVNELSKIEVNNLSGASNDLVSLINALATINDTDYVKVRGRCLNCDDAVALERDVFAEEIKIENNSGEQDVKLQGPVLTKSEPIINIVGVNIDTTNISGFEGFGDSATFFSTVLPGNIVSVEGVLSGPTINWDSIELEDDE